MDSIRSALSPYARNILEELRRHAGGLLKVREPDLIRLSKVPAVRIIEARDELEKCLNELTEHNLISYEKRGDRYTIRNISEKHVEQVGQTKTKEDHLCQGRLHSVKGEYEEAVEEYEKALEIDPHYQPARVNVGLTSYMNGPLNEDKIPSNKYMKLPKRN